MGRTIFSELTLQLYVSPVLSWVSWACINFETIKRGIIQRAKKDV